MPIYEYECQDCHHHFERIQKFSDAPISECPACHSASANRLISAPAFKLKGTGWYETDFKNKGKAPESKASSSNTTSVKTETTTSSSNSAQVDSGVKATSKGEAV